jgi:hypothetical protein
LRFISSRSEEFVVVRRPLGFTWIERPRSGAAGLMADTSNASVASAGIGRRGVTDPGIVFAGVARVSTSGPSIACVNVPAIISPFESSRPS